MKNQVNTTKEETPAAAEEKVPTQDAPEQAQAAEPTDKEEKAEPADDLVQPVPDVGPKQNPQAPRSLIMKLAAAMGEVGWIQKRGQNTHFNYKYAMESDILDAIRSRLAVRHVFVQTLIDKITEVETNRTQGKDNHKIMKSIVWTRHIFHDGESGESMEVNGYGVGEDTADKGPYKAMTGAMKYAMSKNFLISSGDDPEKEEGDDEQHGASGKDSKKAEVRRASDSNGNQQVGSYDDVIVDMSKKSGGVGKNAWTRYGIRTQERGWVSTFDPVIAEAAAKLNGSGFVCRFKTEKDGQYVKLTSFSELDPDGNPAMSYGEG